MMNLALMIAKGESKTLEFKRELPRFEQIAKTVIAFANTSGGRLLIGVADDGRLVGIAADDVLDLQERLYASLYEQIHPTLTPEIYISNIDGVLLLVIEVFRGQSLPYFLKHKSKAGGVFVRLGASNRVASLEYIAELERQRQHISFDEEACCEVAMADVDDSALVQRFAACGLTLDDVKRRNLRLIQTVQGKDYPTYGLLILLGYFEHVSTQCARFRGVNMQVFLDRKEYSGDLFGQLEHAEQFIHSHLSLRTEIHSLQRTDTREIPDVAIREALINAYVHRDYSNFGRNIKIGIYDDMVNIVSAGGFPNSLTAQDLAEGRSEIRNRVLARVFKALGYIEQWGSGIQRMLHVCLAAGLPVPQIEEKSDFVDVALLRQMVSDTQPKSDDLSSIIPDSMPSADDYGRLRMITDDYLELTHDQQRVLFVLLEAHRLTRSMVMDVLQVARSKAFDVLQELVALGLIVRRGNGRATVYVLKEITP
jgi:ATP-dependent DNA helicase RecG